MTAVAWHLPMPSVAAGAVDVQRGAALAGRSWRNQVEQALAFLPVRPEGQPSDDSRREHGAFALVPMPFQLPQAVLAARVDPPHPAGAARQQPDRQGESAAIRVHVEQGPAGWQVWIGLDGRAPTTRTAAVACELRRLLHGSPQRVASIVCNGSTVYGTTSLPHVTQESA